MYGPLYLISLLPFFILYRISDLAFFFIYYVGRYRKDIVIDNLDRAFPHKSNQEKEEIAKKFYRNLTDNFIETIKLITLSKRSFDKRVSMDLSVCKRLEGEGRNLLFCTGHQMNWEYGNRVMAERMSSRWIGIYMKIKDPVVERLFYNLRTKQGAVLIPAQEFGSKADAFKQQYLLGLVADQNPGRPRGAYWLNFFGKPTPFIIGPDRWAMRNDTAVFFTSLIKIKRGYYRFVPTLITEDSRKLKPGELTMRYRDFLEQEIRDNPDNYLWSHRRWKWQFTDEYKNRWIDRVPPNEHSR